MANRIIPDHRPHERTFLPLSAAAKLCWVMATIELGASGIGKCHAATLVPLTSLPLEEVEAGLAELEAQGHLRRDGAVMWMIANLLEQGLNPRNQNHRASVQSHLTSLEPLAPELVAAFRAHYADWLEPFQETGAPPSSDEPPPIPPEDHPDGIGMVSRAKEVGRIGGKEGGSSSSPDRAPKSESGDLDKATDRPSPAAQNGKRQEPKRRRAVTATQARGASSTAAPPASRRSPLPEAALRLLRKCYGWRDGDPPTDRQKAVGKQLRETLGDRGVPYEGAPVRAVDEAHLEWACTAVLDEPPKKPDVAIQWVLLKLRDTYTERLAAKQRATAVAAEREGEKRTALALSWCAAHGGEAYRGEVAELAIELGLGEATAAELELNPIWRTARAALATQHWKRAGSPSMPDDTAEASASERDPPAEPVPKEAPKQLAAVS